MKYLSLFSGIGGFELGIQQAYGALYNESKDDELQAEQDLPSDNSNKLQRATCIGFSEIDKYATQVYQKHFPNHKNYGDIASIDAKDLPSFELLVGGFPCQSFSIAGKRGGFSDTRGTLFFEIARIIEQKQPRLLLLENVKGLLSHDKGNTFATIISTLDELGYDIQWQVLNSKNHGVPQNRERVFIIGHLRGTSRPEVFPFTGGNSKALKYIGGLANSKKWKDDKRDLSRNSSQGERVYDPSGISSCLSAQGGGQGAKTGLYKINKKGKKKKTQDVAGTLTGGGHSGGNHSDMDLLVENSTIRRLTPTECERLQSFPDGWTEGLSDTQRYKCLGNAVTVNVIRDIISKLIK